MQMQKRGPKRLWRRDKHDRDATAGRATNHCSAEKPNAMETRAQGRGAGCDCPNKAQFKCRLKLLTGYQLDARLGALPLDRSKLQ